MYSVVAVNIAVFHTIKLDRSLKDTVILMEDAAGGGLIPTRKVFFLICFIDYPCCITLFSFRNVDVKVPVVK